jgi:hypothetical protein
MPFGTVPNYHQMPQAGVTKLKLPAVNAFAIRSVGICTSLMITAKLIVIAF